MQEHSILTLTGLAQAIYSQASLLIYPALFFLFLKTIKHKKNPVEAFKIKPPSSLKVNIISYMIDITVVAATLGWIIGLISKKITEEALYIFETKTFEALPNTFIALLTVFIGDAIGYFRHRLEHSKPLWPSHILHHSDEEMSWFTLFRFHPFNRITTSTIDIGMLLLIGFPLWAIALNSFIRHYYGMLIHANIPWTYGLMGRIFVSPAMHRWHHVLEGRGVGSNYATVFSVFDQLFNTYYVPGPCNQALGVEEAKNKSYFAQLIYPAIALLNILKPKKP